MAILKINGDTSGSVSLTVPAAAGTNTLTFPAVTNTVATQGDLVGVSQTWQNVTSSRATGTTYTNSTGKPIQVMVSQRGGASVYSYAYVSSVQVSQVTTTTATVGIFPTSFIVPNGATYSVTGTIDYWAELR